MKSQIELPVSLLQRDPDLSRKDRAALGHLRLLSRIFGQSQGQLLAYLAADRSESAFAVVG